MDPNEYNYGTKDTRWRYFWNTIWNHQLEVELYNMWTPESIYIDDENIMEIAVSDPFYCGKEKYQVVSVNRS